MTLDELKEAVYTITNRSDLDSETLLAVQAATLKMHQTGFYSKDIYETGIQFESAARLQTLDYLSLLSNYRAFKYFRKASDTSDRSGQFLNILSVEETIDGYGTNLVDVAYVAGRNLEIRSSTAIQYALIGCYVLPIVAESTFSSWVADLAPYAIIYEACRTIFKMIGQDSQNTAYSGLVQEEVRMLRATHLSDVGN